jgi:hypothetical protein
MYVMMGKQKGSILRGQGGRYKGRWGKYEGRESIGTHLAKGFQNDNMPCIIND